MFWLGVTIGFVVGFYLGVLVMCWLRMAARRE